MAESFNPADPTVTFQSQSMPLNWKKSQCLASMDHVAVSSKMELKKFLVWDLHSFGHFPVQVISVGLMGKKVKKAKTKVPQNQPTGILASLFWNISKYSSAQGRTVPNTFGVQSKNTSTGPHTWASPSSLPLFLLTPQNDFHVPMWTSQLMSPSSDQQIPIP